MPRRWFAVAAGWLAILAAACSPSPPTATNPSPTVSISAAVPVSTPTPSPGEPSPTPSAIPSATVYPRLAIPAGTPRCRTTQLEVAFITGGAAAGNLEDIFEMRNRSATGCWVYGYVGFQALDRYGQRLPQSLSWSTQSMFGDSQPPSRILLPAATTPLGVEPRTGHAFFDSFTEDVTCDVYKNPVASIKVWPPDEYQPLTIPSQSLNGLQFVFCGGFGVNPLQVQPIPSFG